MCCGRLIPGYGGLMRERAFEGLRSGRTAVFIYVEMIDLVDHARWSLI